ncbi:helix-turn-helix domain-containing protein [Hyphomicrobium sp. CS1BSMeth3]|uniref:helix-turn-helix domain-containing protein n=1 Tax=Hyphomicrobium sp. CS1BSMeth3 TaxID=1892844 RepID=UPI0009FA6649|nr:helix-turn-helix domain-containing protein [Hyphomicrobium sp. CS1BSMeth3]
MRQRSALRGNGASDPSAQAERPAEIIAARLRSVVVESHFAAREWRLDAGTSSGFDHCLILQTGEAWLHLEGEHLHVLGPAFVWSPAHSAERLVIEAGGSGHIIHIRRDLIEQTFRQIPEAGELINLLGAEQPLALAIEAESAVRLTRLLALISNELQEPRPGSETVISSALLISFVQLWRHVGARALALGETVGAAALLMRFRQLVEERFREQWAVARYAEALGVTPGRLHAIATRTLGRTPRALIQQRLIYEAAVRLERSAITIKQLSYLLGFRDAAYFNRFFAKQVGIPPARYRRAIVHRNVAGHAPPIPFTFYDWP